MAIGWDQAYVDALKHVSEHRSVTIRDSRGYPGFPQENHDLLIRMTSTELASALSFRSTLKEDLATQSRGRQSLRLMYALIGPNENGITETLRAEIQTDTNLGSIWVEYVETFSGFKHLLIAALDLIVTMRTILGSTSDADNEVTMTINENLPISTIEADRGLQLEIGFGSGGL